VACRNLKALQLHFEKQPEVRTRILVMAQEDRTGWWPLELRVASVYTSAFPWRVISKEPFSNFSEKWTDVTLTWAGVYAF